MIPTEGFLLALVSIILIYLVYAAIFIFIAVLIVRKRTALRIGLAVLFVTLSVSPHYYYQYQTHIHTKALKRAMIASEGIDFEGKSILTIGCENACDALAEFSGAEHVYFGSQSGIKGGLDTTAVDLFALVEGEVLLEKSQYLDGEYEINYMTGAIASQIDYVVIDRWRFSREVPELFMQVSEHLSEYGLTFENIGKMLLVFSVEDPHNFSADKIKLALFTSREGKSVPIPYLFLGKSKFLIPNYDFLRSKLRPIFCPHANPEQCQHPY